MGALVKESVSETSVILITEDSLQSSLLKDVLQSSLNVNVFLVSPLHLLDPNPVPDGIDIECIIVDFTSIKGDVFDNYNEFKASRFLYVNEVLINCDKDVSYSELWVWRTLSGVFYASDDVTVLNHGIEKVLDGEMWFSRKISQEYIVSLRSQSKPRSMMKNAKLTNREHQIISLLSDGASNGQIAASLVVSENTVKTHLHNIFKKINAKNRVQALIWAKDNLSHSPSNM